MAIDTRKVIREIIRDRDELNTNNVSRTNYYSDYWFRNPEITWCLLASYVSRNAGYQMTDLARYRILANAVITGAIAVSSVTGLAKLMAILAKYGVLDTIEAVFTLLESGNYLIFQDVFPVLEIYERAKNDRENASDYLSLLTNPIFQIDDFVGEKWYNFFIKADREEFSGEWATSWGANTDIQEHSFALIVNEQNHIEDKLVNPNPPPNHYLKNHLIGKLLANLTIEAAGALGFTRLCFPLSNKKMSRKYRKNMADEILIYEVSGFTKLNDRIQAGRDTYAHLINNGPNSSTTSKLINFCSVFHNGSRAAYNKVWYNDDNQWTLLPGGYKYSPKYRNHWLPIPKKNPKYKHITKPMTLPIPAYSRPNSDLNKWLSPLKFSSGGFTKNSVNHILREIFF